MLIVIVIIILTRKTIYGHYDYLTVTLTVIVLVTYLCWLDIRRDNIQKGSIILMSLILFKVYSGCDLIC